MLHRWWFFVFKQTEAFSTVFPTAFAHFVSLCHILVILTIFQIFHDDYRCYDDLVIRDLGCYYYDSLKA